MYCFQCNLVMGFVDIKGTFLHPILSFINNIMGHLLLELLVVSLLFACSVIGLSLAGGSHLSQ